MNPRRQIEMVRQLPVCPITHKRGHATANHAARCKRGLAKFSRSDVACLNHWRCRHCGFWHIGHPRPISTRKGN